MHVCVVRGEQGGGYNLNFWGGGPGRAGVPIHCRGTTAVKMWKYMSFLSEVSFNLWMWT